MKKTITCLALAMLLPVIAGAKQIAGTQQGYYALSFPGWGTYANDGAGSDTNLTPAEATSLASGDFDGDGTNDLVAAFGSGVWVYVTNVWSMITPATATNGVAAGDLNGDGVDEVIMAIGGDGVWKYDPVADTTVQVNAANAEVIATGDLDGNGTNEVLMSFPDFGVWVDDGTTSWPLTAAFAEYLATGDIDGDGDDEALMSITNSGVWAHDAIPAATNILLHSIYSDMGLVAADIDGDGDDEAILDYAALGIWANDGAWGSNTQVHAVGAELMAAGDTDWDGVDELLLSFDTIGEATGVVKIVSGVEIGVHAAPAGALAVVESSSVIPSIPDFEITLELLPGTNALTLTWTTGVFLYDYTLQSKSNLVAQGTWTTNTTITGTGGDVTVTTAVNQVKSFYRVIAE